MTPLSQHNYVLNNLITAVLILDEHLQVIDANPSAEGLFGLSLRRLRERHIDELLLLPADAAERLALAPGSGHSFTLNELPLQRSEPLLVTASITPLPRDHGQHQLLLEMQRTDKRQQLDDETHQLAQQEAAQDLVRSLAHEIKNPLGGLRGAAQLLDQALPDDSLREYTQLIIEQADRLRQLVDRLLGPRRLPRYQHHNIHQITERVLQLAQLQCPDSITLRRDYDPSLPDLLIDADQIEQTLLNLVNNAIDALNGQGEIVIRTRPRRQLTIHGRRHRLVLEVSVVDNGPGIPKALRDTLFYPMVTGKNQGSGLGLSIAQSLARLHQGRIDYHSQPGCTEFILQLPLNDVQGDKGAIR